MPTQYSPAERQGFIQQAIAAGVPASEIDVFLQYNPGDEHRILDAFTGVRREDYSAANPQTAPVLQPRAPSGELIQPERSDAAIYATYQRSPGVVPSIATSGPPGPMGYASFPALSGYAPGSAGGSGGLMAQPTILGFDPMTLALLAGAGLLAWYLLKD
jgi:hypothetical protein